MAVYVDDGSALLVNGGSLKAISFYWRDKISSYQSTLNRYGLKHLRGLEGPKLPVLKGEDSP